MTDLDLRGRLTLNVHPETSGLLDIGRDAAYAAIDHGEIPAIRIGRTIRVPTHALLRKLGWPDSLIATALGVEAAPATDTEAGCSLQPATATIHAFAQEDGDSHHGALTAS